MPAPAVDQHQGMIGAESPQRERSDDIAGVSHALMSEVHRGRERPEDLAGFGRPLLLQLFSREHVYRNGKLLLCGVAGPRAYDYIDRSQLHGSPDQGEIALFLAASRQL